MKKKTGKRTNFTERVHTYLSPGNRNWLQAEAAKKRTSIAALLNALITDARNSK